MIFYGDRSRSVNPDTELASVELRLRRAEARPPGLMRHQELVSALVSLGELTQGIADLDRERRGTDGTSVAEALIAVPLMQVAQAVVQSWNTGFAQPTQFPTIAGQTGLAGEIVVRVPEGYAFYTVYPEAYAQAARALTLLAPPRVIGIRSIGTSLGAIVAAALDAPPPLSVRPVGPYFTRRIDVDPNVAAEWTGGQYHYVIVDEGPGLSGSSFAAVVNWLRERGVPLSHIALLPSHAGEPGPEAHADIRNMWSEIQRQVIIVDDLIPPARIVEWAQGLFSRIDAPPTEISGGAWRRFRYDHEREWPAVVPSMERCKWLLDADGQRWMLKFAGIGEEGERKMAQGLRLSEAGLTPPMRGFLHGWTVERWIETVPGDADHASLITFVARYLGQRARCLPPPRQAGADLRTLFEMARHNIGEAIDSYARERFERLFSDFGALQTLVQPMAIDGRMDRHEWLRLAEGEWLKADALDHDGAHDLIGPQDLAWDVAGAIVELGLDRDAAETLHEATAVAAGRAVDGELLRFLLPCYAAFRIGLAHMAIAALDNWPAEAARNQDAAERYAATLQTLLWALPQE